MATGSFEQPVEACTGLELPAPSGWGGLEAPLEHVSVPSPSLAADLEHVAESGGGSPWGRLILELIGLRA